MTFYGPTFPNEAHYETLLTGRQRFGNRSANMFFVRPARHIACPRRLKYIQDVKTGYIPYVEDSGHFNRLPYAQALQNVNDDMLSKKNGLGLYNSTDAWRHELKDLAQQVKSTLVAAEEQEQYLRQTRLSRFNKKFPRRSNSSVSSALFDDNDEQFISKRLLKRRISTQNLPPKLNKPKPTNEKSQTEPTPNEENQDAGIWLIPILCYILQMDNIFEAQEWLVNANPTEKRLAMELISRTMQDMQNHDNDVVSDVTTSDFSSAPTTAAPNLNNVYWPFKVWQRQEKDRQEQQQMQSFLKQSKLSSYPSSSSINNDNGDTCERATSPLRILTPAKRSLSTTIANNYPHPIETSIIERPATRNSNDRVVSTPVHRPTQSQRSDQPSTVDRRSSLTVIPPIIINGNDRHSRRSHRVTTSLSTVTWDRIPVLYGRNTALFNGRTVRISAPDITEFRRVATNDQSTTINHDQIIEIVRKFDLRYDSQQLDELIYADEDINSKQLQSYEFYIQRKQDSIKSFCILVDDSIELESFVRIIKYLLREQVLDDKSILNSKDEVAMGNACGNFYKKIMDMVKSGIKVDCEKAHQLLLESDLPPIE